MYKQIYGRAKAVANISGIGETSDIAGTVSFYDYLGGTLVLADIKGLPSSKIPGDSRIFGFHIHEGTSCTGPGFTDTGGHFNPYGRTHPHHAGDLPPLFETGGRAYMAVLTGRLRIPDIVGRTLVIHSKPDDFTSQPAGNAGEKIACGVIRNTNLNKAFRK